MAGGTEWHTERLGKHHDRSAFDCGRPVLDRYLREIAGQDRKRNAAVTWVLVDGSDPTVAAYYTLSAYAVVLSGLPDDIAARLPTYPHVPTTLIGRLAVSIGYQGQGLGEYVLMDALRRALHSADAIASAGVVVHAIDDVARAFYERYDFRDLADGSLFLGMATIRTLPL